MDGPRHWRVWLPTSRRVQQHDYDKCIQNGSSVRPGCRARSTRRWALEEAGLPYKTELIDPTIQGTAEYRALQLFGQVPIYEEDGLKLFESGSILLHIASRCPELMPADEVGRARATTWVFAALNSIEPFAQQLAALDLFYPLGNVKRSPASCSPRLEGVRSVQSLVFLMGTIFRSPEQPCDFSQG